MVGRIAAGGLDSAVRTMAGFAGINAIVKAQRGISADTALRLARFFGTSPELWMNLQARHDLLTAQAKLGRELRKVEALHAA
jgi:plasmid maintenance system antidote protein VapI